MNDNEKDAFGCILFVLYLAIVTGITATVSLFFGIAWGMLALVVMLVLTALFIVLVIRKAGRGKKEDTVG